jgi:hypothetical protein
MKIVSIQPSQKSSMKAKDDRQEKKSKYNPQTISFSEQLAKDILKEQEEEK